MAEITKTIKFNLICDGNPIRTIEDLQNNFSVEDILEYYNNSLLHRWLSVRGYSREQKEVQAIASSGIKEPVEIIKELIRIFNITADKKTIEQSVYMLQYLDERRKRCQLCQQENNHVNHIIQDYEKGYRRLVEGILENPDDVAKIKANIAEITSNYAWALKLDHRSLFYLLKEKSVLAVMCLLMNRISRNYYIPIEKTSESGITYFDTDTSTDKKEMFQSICSLTGADDFMESLGKNLISFSGVTDGYWKDLEPKGKHYMIISIGKGDFVRSAGISGGDLGEKDIKDKFRIVDGIDYKSNSSVHKLLYMEV